MLFNHIDILELMLDMAFNYVDASLATPLLRSIVNNDRKGVAEALRNGFSANLPDNRGWTPLHEAVIDNARSECLKELLSHRSANVNMQTFLHETPLFLACQHKCLKAVKLLLNHPKCDINITNSEGVSPLHIACSVKDIQIVKILVQFGAKVNFSDLNGYTPLHESVSGGGGSRHRLDEISYEICLLLLSHGAKPSAVEYEGNMAFHFACQNGLLKCVELLYSSSNERDLINHANNDGRTPLMMAVPSQNMALVEMLLSNGANPNIEDNNNVIALHLAAHSAHCGIFSLIHKATTLQCIMKTCTFDEERDVEQILSSKKVHSLICYAIDTEDLEFLRKVLESDLDQTVLQCPVIHAENLVKRSFTLHTPISFLLEGKMYELGDETVEFLQALIDHGSPLKVTSKNSLVSYINPICAALVALNDCSSVLVMKCLRILLSKGADPDEPYGRMPYSMEQACMRGCVDAALLLLQYSNVLEPEDVIKWIEKETSLASDQQKIVALLLPLAPYYHTSSDDHLQDKEDTLRKTELRQVYPLTSYCRAIIRRQLHQETRQSPTMFKKKLLNLHIPTGLHRFLSYI